ncbi:uncharacterized protein LOC114266139 isoform X2 [Camellia sinensis]|uniref:uncharacterized protein LOC114266139 isoform X2 n=1 Tax=Camellia sinensis TaxID=4442 RepID=UPI0010367788|nr:uncharacterized protein LOC114266139 isoform X2 [Camellia sinensis]
MELQVAIVNSQTLEEVARLEKILKLVIMMPRPTLKQPKKTTVTDEENEANDGPSDAEPEQKNESADMEQDVPDRLFGLSMRVQIKTYKEYEEVWINEIWRGTYPKWNRVLFQEY